MKSKKKKHHWGIFIFLLISIYIFIGLLPSSIDVTHYNYKSGKLPLEFNGFKIVQISDLHNKNFGKNQSELIHLIKKENPDIIVLTGDIVDEDHDNLKSVEDLLMGIKDISPVYFVSGNHEQCREAQIQYSKLKLLLNDYGVTILNDNSHIITINNSSITLTGSQYYGEYTGSKLPKADKDSFNILLCHDNNVIDTIYDYGYDIILSGHCHGGIIRLPYLGGVIGNSRNLFPKYDAGVFEKGNCTQYISRGLGDADVPRFYNPPELVVITLHSLSG